MYKPKKLEIEQYSSISDFLFESSTLDIKWDNSFRNQVFDGATFLTSASKENSILSDESIYDLEDYNLHHKAFLTKELKECEIEYGFSNKIEEVISQEMRRNKVGILALLNEIFLENFNDKDIVLQIIYMISSFGYKDVYPQGITMSIAALSHESSEIKDAAIGAFENWQSKDSVVILKSIDTQIAWLEEYKTKVINAIESQ